MIGGILIRILKNTFSLFMLKYIKIYLYIILKYEKEFLKVENFSTSATYNHI